MIKEEDLIDPQLIGSGGFGDTYRVTDRNNIYIHYCKKVIKFDKIDEKEFKNETTILSKLQHINIIKMVGNYYNPDNGDFSIIMEYARGGDLAKKILLRKGRGFKFSEIMNIFIQIVVGLDYIHSCGIIHRDIKPQNILIQKELVGGTTVKVADFGLSKILENTEYTNTRKGTYDYVSPEILNVQPYTNKIDIWSLGVLLNELMSLNVPYKGGVPNEGEIPKIDPSKFSDNQDLNSLLVRLLDPNPDLRYSTKEILNVGFIKHYIENNGFINFYLKHGVEIYKAPIESDKITNAITNKMQYIINIGPIVDDSVDTTPNIAVNPKTLLNDYNSVFKSKEEHKKMEVHNTALIVEESQETKVNKMDQKRKTFEMNNNNNNINNINNNIDYFYKLENRINDDEQDQDKQEQRNCIRDNTLKYYEENSNYVILKTIGNKLGFDIDNLTTPTIAMILELVRSKVNYLSDAEKKKFSSCINYAYGKQREYLEQNKNY
ncbi:hypothetical protein CYY_002459 [Polysphondylium violaceum]|uniref:non-specific serine/threonine protein kinase n=1 Tax=Polysphondylium violaceum TaxID=133409 RepID=A0A8J4PWA4_9MYCE|nr:hypothetical protein CYY_002459 [Polysphondylium violaceum]